MSKKLNNFIKKANIIHDNKYDYSLVDYKNNKTKIKIYCKICNLFFEQIPYHHYNGHGCPKCSKNKKLTTQEFIEKSKLIHNNKYDYSLADYKNMHLKIKIICPIHGIFEQTPLNHLLKKGCYQCSKHKKLTTKEFIEKAIKIHGDKYDYSLSIYKKNNEKIKIICKYHNYIFEQIPTNHIDKKHNCPLCGNKNRRLKRLLEILKNKYNGEQIIPSFNHVACDIFNKISKITNTDIQHAMNGGEYYLEKLGYWLDGYDKLNNIVYEYDEQHHFDKDDNLLKKDITRQNEIINFLNCKFIRIKYNENILEKIEKGL